MKTVYISWTYLTTIEVPDNATKEEIEDMIALTDIPTKWNDREWSVIE